MLLVSLLILACIQLFPSKQSAHMRQSSILGSILLLVLMLFYCACPCAMYTKFRLLMRSSLSLSHSLSGSLTLSLSLSLSLSNSVTDIHKNVEQMHLAAVHLMAHGSERDVIIMTLLQPLYGRGLCYWAAPTNILTTWWQCLLVVLPVV